MNTVRGLLTTHEAMDGDGVEIPAGWRFDQMQSRLCGYEDDRNRSFLGVGFVV